MASSASETLREEIEVAGRTGYIVPPMPKRLDAIRAWVCAQHDAYSLGHIDSDRLNQCRKTAANLGDLHRASADVKKAEAAMESAQAQTRMAEVLAAFEHGGPAVAMLARLQEGLGEGRRRALPGRAVKSIAAGSEPA